MRCAAYLLKRQSLEFLFQRRLLIKSVCIPQIPKSRSLAAFLAETDPGRFNNIKQEFAAAAASAAARRHRGAASSSSSSAAAAVSPATWIHRLSPARGSMLRPSNTPSPIPANLAYNSRW